MNRRCKSCEPHPAHAPSGIVWLHANSCSLHPGEKVGYEKLRKPAEKEARKLHPAGKTETGNYPATNFSKGFDGWHRQPKVGAMPEAVQYVDDHLDDELEDSDA